jgi:hypothetical protein
MSVEIIRSKANQLIYGNNTCYTVWIKGDYSTLKSFASKSEAEAYAKRFAKRLPSRR